MPKKVVIVGGVAGGATTAARLRRLDERAEIIMLEKDGYISFANCGLPYHIGGAIPHRNALLLQTPEAMHARFNIDVRTFSEVVAVDTAKKTVHVKSIKRGDYTESYDVLVLCPGAQPVRIASDATAAQRVFTLRNIDDLDHIMRWLCADAAQAVVVGAGFIGLETAENLLARGMDVHVVGRSPHILASLDEDIARIAEQELYKHGVQLSLGVDADRVESTQQGVRVVLKDGRTLDADIVISATGVRPATAFLQDSGIALGPKGHIVVDDHMRTNIPDVYAAGDAVQIRDFVLGRPTGVALAGPANRQARLIADNIAGLNHAYGGAQATAIIKLFDLTAAWTGANERTLKKEGIAYHKVVTHPFSSATYYPGARQFTAKLLFSPEGTILGCQMIGAEGVDKRLDVVATAMRLGAHVTQLSELELAYAPPYSSAKDPVNMLGYIAENVLLGISDFTDAHMLEDRDPAAAILLDVRTAEEYARGHAHGAVNIPLDELRGRMGELDKNKEILEYCQVGVRAHTAQRLLKQNGFRVKNITGGYRSLKQ